MEIHLKISVIGLPNGKFIPEFHFYEVVGNLITNIMTPLGEESLCDSREQALNLAKAHARKFALERYGADAQIAIHEEKE